MLYQNAPDLAEKLREDGICYGVSVGRRQPMHRVHLDCLKEILAHGLRIICVHGSVNPPGSPFYNLDQNPLTYDELKAQVDDALPGAEVMHLALADRGDAALWSQDLVNLLGGKISQSVMHYRRKATDEPQADIKPLGETEAHLERLGLSIWESKNSNPADDRIHASDLRTLDIRHLTSEQKRLFAAPDFIRSVCERGGAESLKVLAQKRK